MLGGDALVDGLRVVAFTRREIAVDWMVRSWVCYDGFRYLFEALDFEYGLGGFVQR